MKGKTAVHSAGKRRLRSLSEGRQSPAHLALVSADAAISAAIRGGAVGALHMVRRAGTILRILNQLHLHVIPVGKGERDCLGGCEMPGSAVPLTQRLGPPR